MARKRERFRVGRNEIRLYGCPVHAKDLQENHEFERVVNDFEIDDDNRRFVGGGDESERLSANGTAVSSQMTHNPGPE